MDKLLAEQQMIAVFMDKETVIWECECCGIDVRKMAICEGDARGNKRTHALGGRVIDLFYRSSWAWIMPVCKAISMLAENGVIPQSKEYEDWINRMEDAITRNYDVNKVYEVVVDIIEWFNAHYKK